MICLHGFIDTWRVWELVLPVLERRHDVLALTLPGHAGGAAIHGPVTGGRFLAAVEHAMDAAGFPIAHIVGKGVSIYLR